jgi:hypothetical protein
MYSKSTDDGVTWSSRTALWSPTPATESYWTTDSNGTDRIDFAATNGTSGTANVYHFYYTGGNVYKSNGTLMGAATTQFTTADATQVYSGASSGARFVGSLAYNAGNPIIVFPVGEVTAAADFKYATSAAGVWTVRQIVNTGRFGDAWFEGGIVLDQAAPTHVYLPVYTAGQWQVFLYITTDAGVTWATRQLSTGADASFYPHVVRNHGSSLVVIWLYGTATAYTNYSLGIVGSAIAAIDTSASGGPGIWIDPDRDGFLASATNDPDAPLARMLPEGSSSVSDNITSEVISFSISQPGDPGHTGGSHPATCVITVKNSTGKWNPDNTASVLYGKPVLGAPLWIGVNADGTVVGSGQTVHGVFAGYVREVVPMPEPGVADGTPTAQIICDDPLVEYGKRKARVTMSTTRTVKSFRQAILSAIGETAARQNLANESDTLPITGNVGARTATVLGRTNTTGTLARPRNAPENALVLLEELNQATGTRHYIQPADSKEAFYYYTTVLRSHKVGSVADASWNADDLGVSDYKSSTETIINTQQAEVAAGAVDVTPVTVWTLPDPVAMDAGSYKEIIATFGDYVFDGASQSSVTGSVTVSVTYYGEGAIIRLDASGAGSLNSLFITGRRVNRKDAVTVERTDSASKATYRERSGESISTDYLQSTGSAEGIVNFRLWKFAQPLKRPTVTLVNELSTTLARELYDVVTLTADALDVASKRFEITGRELHVPVAASATVLSYNWTYNIQQTPNASAMSLFTIGSSTLGGSDGLAP